MSDRLQTIIDHVASFDLTRVRERYVMDFRATPEDAESLERELKRFLVLRALSPNVPYGMTGKVDDLWHIFILFTRDYARFCQDVAGTFLHHDLGGSGNGGAAGASDGAGDFRTSYARFFKDYAAVFGENPPPSAWPTLADVRRLTERIGEGDRARSDAGNAG